MTTRIEYGTKAAADQAREEYGEFLCSEDDRRLKTVAFSSDTPESVIETERREAEMGHGERSDGAGQVPLSDHEREQIDFSAGRANIAHARSVKGIASDEGVEDWLAYYDSSLTVDEHREVMDSASRESGRRSDTDDAADRAAEAAKAAASEECDHARGHCRHGDPDACEFLANTCGYDEDEVQTLLGDFESEPESAGEQAESGLTGKQKGALKRSWNGYKAAISALDSRLPEITTQWRQAQQAAKAINAIRDDADQESIDFERLESLQEALHDLVREMAADCHECHIGTDQGTSLSDIELHEGDADAPETSDVLDTEDDGQVDLAGEATEGDEQAELAVEPDVRASQGRETRREAAKNSGGILADERADPSRGATSDPEASDQQQFRDPEQGTIDS